MDDAFEILDPQNAQNLLKRFLPEARRKGQSLFAGGRVNDFQVIKPGSRYNTFVEDPADVLLPVKLCYDPEEGWTGTCSCGKGPLCAHVYASLRSLVAEHSNAVVRSLSASRPTQAAASALAAKDAAEPGLARRLRAAVNRPLNAAENRFIRKVQAAYKRSMQRGNISVWDFAEMELPLEGYSWNTLQIWPAFPKDEFEFWLYVARTAQKNSMEVPEFMLPITDFTALEEKIARWERQQEVTRWNDALERTKWEMPTGSVADIARGETELRMVIGPDAARLEWRRPGREAFEPLKGAQISRINDEERTGWLRFTTESSLMWQLLAQRFFYTSSSQLRYADNEAAMPLGRVLRAKLLENQVVTMTGEPLSRPAEPLRWEMTPAEDEGQDYRFRLIQADGSAVPEILRVIPGEPSLYLTANALFQGPKEWEHLLDPMKENRIPAPAIERATGVSFLQSLGVPLPARVAERVQTLPLEVIINCELAPSYMGGRTEECVFQVRAAAEDGHSETWNGAQWTFNEELQRVKKPAKRSTSIVLYDRKAAAQIPVLLSSLNLKSDSWTGRLALRVTKKFPEVFSEWLKTVPPQITVQLAGELASFASADVSGSVKLDVKETEIDWFDLRVVLDVTDTTLSQEEIRLLLNAKGNYVRLNGKGWRRLQFDLTEDENDRLARLGLNPRELSDEPQRLHALQLADDAAKKFMPEQQVAQIQRRAAELKARVAPALPSAITAELRPYQLEGFHFLAYLSTNRFGGILADDMGLGKTLQTLAWLVWLREESRKTATAEPAEIAPSLVVCPKSVMDNWQAEAQRFTPGLRVKGWGPGELSQFPSKLADADLHVINYNQLRTVGENLVSVRWLTLILDEGQYIKNPSSQTALVARAMRAEHRLVLSGTPIENRLMDLWSLMAFAMPGVLGSRAQFGRSYDAKGDPFARKRLSSRVRPFLLRRTKTQVAKDLPDRTEEDLFCEIEGEQKALYRAELKRAQQMLLRIQTQKELAQQHFHFLTSLLRLRQICCHPRLINGNSPEMGAKTEALLEQLEPLMEEGQKVLVFSQFVELLQLLKPPIEERGWPIFYLAGETENRGDLVKRFQAAEGPAVFLISLKAGGFGLNLTAASYVILFDPWWNPAVENQAIDRTHRIGQVNKVIAYRLLIKNSIEEKIRALQKQKNALAQDILGEERFAQSLTLQDLQFLLAD
jgi:hypothetical protein